MSASSYNFNVNGFLDGVSPLNRPINRTSTGLFPLSERLVRGQSDYVIDAPLGIIDLNEFFGQKLAYWMPFLDIQGPNGASVDSSLSRVEIVRTPGAPEQIYNVGVPFVSGDAVRFAAGVIPAGYVMRMELRDAGGALVPGPWRIYMTVVPLRSADDVCCLCDLALAFEGGGDCEPPVLNDVSPSLVSEGLLGPPPFPLTLTGANFLPDDEVTITPVVPGPPSTISFGPRNDTSISLTWTPGAGVGDYEVRVNRAGDPSCASQIVPIRYQLS